MRRRVRFAMLVTLLTLQAFAVAPITFAAGAGVHSAALAEHSSDHEADGASSDCPCCPEGGVMVAGCMSLCTAFVAAAAVVLPLLKPVPDPAIPFDEPTSPTQTYPPLNPPPIA